MKTQVSVARRAYPNSVRESVEAKLQLLARYFERIESLRAVLEREREDHRVELIVHVGHGATLVVEAKASSMNAALDESMARMKSLLTRHKQRLVQRHRRARKEED